jgi:hypothetical protein
MVGSGLQHVRVVRKEETVEVVENHEGGTSPGGGTPGPKESEGRETGGSAPGVDFRTGETTEG